MTISVCLATYNGEKFIYEQIDSILKQISSYDEVIIVDDFSIDSTVQIIRNLNDSRIKIFINKQNMGHVYSFGRAIDLATKEVIFLSDQDDIWMDNRVNFMIEQILKSNALLVSTNSKFIDTYGNQIDYTVNGVNSKNSNNYWSNIIDIYLGKKNYFGCTMAFRKELKSIILPIPSYVESHDLWIALAANINKSNLHCDVTTLERRIHRNNASIIKRKFILQLWSRIVFSISLVELIIRKCINKN
jgi:glycosyltransferase involved in cell wall biosynthesis